MNRENQDLGSLPAAGGIPDAAPVPPAGSPSIPRGPGPAGILLLSLTVSLAVAVGSLFVYDIYFAQKVVALDMKGYLAEQRDLYLDGRIDDEELRRRIDRLEAASLAIPGNRVVLMGDAVIRNAEVIRP